MRPWAPFGFEEGLTVEELERAVGPLVASRRSTSVYRATRAPEPHPAFEQYLLGVDPGTGLAKVLALGRAIPTDGFGKAVRAEFERLRAELRASYGEGETTDRVIGGAWWSRPEQFTWGLVRRARLLETVWTHAPPPRAGRLTLVRLPGEVRAVQLKASASSPRRGRVTLACQFSNWDELARVLRGGA